MRPTPLRGGPIARFQLIRKRHHSGRRRLGLQARVVDFSFFPFGDQFETNKEQIERVVQRSDAFELKLAGKDVMVAYLLEVTRLPRSSSQPE